MGVGGGIATQIAGAVAARVAVALAVVLAVTAVAVTVGEGVGVGEGVALQIVDERDHIREEDFAGLVGYADNCPIVPPNRMELGDMTTIRQRYCFLGEGFFKYRANR